MYPGDESSEHNPATPQSIAADLKVMCRPDHENRPIADSLAEYWREWLRATWDRVPNATREMRIGGEAGYSVMGAVSARYYCEVYRMAVNRHDPDDNERLVARAQWEATDWESLWAEMERDERAKFADAESRRAE